MATFDDLIISLGEPAFAEKLLKLIDDVFEIEHLVVDGFDIHRRPMRLYHCSKSDRDELALIFSRYHNGNLFSSDPVVQRVRKLKIHDTNNASRQLFFMLEDSLTDKLSTQLYKGTKVSQRPVLLFTFRRRWFAIKMLRSRKLDPIDDRQFRHLLDRYPSLLHIVGWHSTYFIGSQSLRYKEAAARYEALIQSLGTSLSIREIEVCARALCGLSNEKIGMALGVSEGTVRTLRNRAFAKLGISQIQELGTLCLSQLG